MAGTPDYDGVRTDENWKYAEKAMTWCGWGSPVGAGIFVVSVGVFLLLARFAVLGL